MQQNKLVCIPTAKIFIYLFTAMLRDVTITSLLSLCIICYKTDVYPPANSSVNGSTSVEALWFRSVSRMGKTNMIFIHLGAKVNSSYHVWFVLGKGLLPDIQARCHQHKWTFQQDDAPANTVRNRPTTDYLKKEKSDFIEPDMWPPNSPDLNSVDYAVWRPFSKQSTTEENLTQWKSWSER